MGKKLLKVFACAFILNLVWENLHSFLYVHYKGAPITELVLIKAAAFDALFITVFSILFFRIRFFRERAWLFLVIGIVFAVCLEWFALSTGRWEYNSLMPIIPILGSGITPSIQLGLLGYITLKISKNDE